MTSKVHSQLNESDIQKVNYPDLAEVRYDQNSDKIFVGIPTQNHYIQNGIPIPNGFLITPIYNNEIPCTNVPFDAQGSVIPIQMQCKYCRKIGTTIMQHRAGPQTWIVSFLLFIFFLPLFFLPFLLENCKDKVHYCPNCGQCVGKKKYKLCNSD
ncbi:unnamed protein product (macronuclear) [Paramecium tetraurelia]|uniref:LITAF domain-containing protein n=1 Tax=Paramecium tetraurelia TaxID=5888 RepID=A0CDP5_PARTE|nr:uncharacterized protein GSPATT00007124001 [Paramecium tetraurelia]CAK68912.1 unnamed protein product [Paramecium tetraurelia]|eukprot:XP_001436309.1 hypothetical protein (macronuclear) [Paramecium tetraurelia strain d4-2]